MKDSGIPWLGQIPEHWNICSFKRLVRIYNGSDYVQVQVDEGGFPVVGSGGEFARANSFHYDGEAIFIGRKGTIDRPFYIKGKFWAIDTVFYCVPQCVANGKYYYYQAINFPYKRYITSTTRPSLTQTDLGNNIVILPPLAEQERIAEYLDGKCAEIDELISVEERMIAELQAYKQSIITETVTRGLNPDAPLKDSGIPWLGQIPEHWQAMRMRFVCEFRNGYTPSKNNLEFWTDGNIPWYRMDDIRQRGRKLKEANQYITKEAVKGGGLFEAGSFILATTATIGEHAQLIVDSLANQQFTNLEIRKSLLNTRLSSCYFFYYLFVVDDYCKTTTNSATFAAVNIKDLSNFIVTLPPIPEQKAIAEYLDRKCEEIDALVEMKQRKIEELKEYKKSVIYEYVTGKREIS